MRIFSLSTLECTKLLTASRLGHLACTKDGRHHPVGRQSAHLDGIVHDLARAVKRIRAVL